MFGKKITILKKIGGIHNIIPHSDIAMNIAMSALTFQRNYFAFLKILTRYPNIKRSRHFSHVNFPVFDSNAEGTFIFGWELYTGFLQVRAVTVNLGATTRATLSQNWTVS